MKRAAGGVFQDKYSDQGAGVFSEVSSVSPSVLGRLEKPQDNKFKDVIGICTEESKSISQTSSEDLNIPKSSLDSEQGGPLHTPNQNNTPHFNNATNYQPKLFRKLSYDKVSQANTNNDKFIIEFKKINVEDLNKAGNLKESAYILHEIPCYTNSHLFNHHELRKSSTITYDDDQLSKIKGSPTFEIHSFKTLQQDKIKGKKCILYQFLPLESDAALPKYVEKS